MDDKLGYETKATSNSEVVAAFDEIMRTFEEFKTSNNDRIESLEKRSVSDVLTTEKVDRINQVIDEQKQALDKLLIKAARPQFSLSHSALPLVTQEHKSAFDSYVRNGEASGLKHLEQKAMQSGAGDGGYLVPADLEEAVGRTLAQISPIRSIATVQQTTGTTFRKPVTIASAATGWVAETDARTETTAPDLAELTFDTGEIYAMPAASPQLLDDAAVNVDEWLAAEIEVAFAEKEGTAFVNGDGVSKPKGFMQYTKVANNSWSWGNLGYVATGSAGAFSSTSPSDAILDLIYSLRGAYRANANFVMNRKTQAEVRKLKDAQGHYLWAPSITAGTAATILNFPVVESEDMANIAANSYSIAFGDFRRGYLVVDRQGIRVLRDPYSAKPYVLFYTTKRVGGGVQDFDALKLLKFAAS